jgi:hypothetical protein
MRGGENMNKESKEGFRMEFSLVHDLTGEESSEIVNVDDPLVLENVRESMLTHRQLFDKIIFEAVFAGQVPLIWQSRNKYAVASIHLYQYQKALIEENKRTNLKIPYGDHVVTGIQVVGNKKELLTGFYARHGLREKNLRIQTNEGSKRVKGVIIKKPKIIKRHKVENAFPCASRN